MYTQTPQTQLGGETANIVQILLPSDDAPVQRTRVENHLISDATGFVLLLLQFIHCVFTFTSSQLSHTLSVWKADKSALRWHMNTHTHTHVFVFPVISIIYTPPFEDVPMFPCVQTWQTLTNREPTRRVRLSPFAVILFCSFLSHFI